MKKYKIKEILDIRGNVLYYEIYKRNWRSLFSWERTFCCYSYETALACMGSRKHKIEVWTYEGGDGILKRKKQNETI